MSGKRLLDLTAIFNASRSVAQKHLALRSRHLDVFNRTSTLARAVRSQTERISETAKAAAFLASRLNESPPDWAGYPADPEDKKKEEPIPFKASTEGPTTGQQKEGLEQDHFYERPNGNVGGEKPAEGELDIKQEQADRYPLPDGTIPPLESDIGTAKTDGDTTPKWPQGEPPKDPLEHSGLDVQQETADVDPLRDGSIPPQGAGLGRETEDNVSILRRPGDEPERVSVVQEGFRPAPWADSTTPPSMKDCSSEMGSFRQVSTDQPSYKIAGLSNDKSCDYQSYSNMEQRIPSVEAVPERDQVPDGINTDVFYSSRIAKSLGEKAQGRRNSQLELNGVTGTPIDHTKVSKGRDQDTFSVRKSSDAQPTSPDTTQDSTPLPRKRSGSSQYEIEQLAQEISEEVSQKANSELPQTEPAPYELRESKVPSSRLGRLWNYGGLAAGMFGGAISESIRRVSGNGGEGSYMLSAGNMDRLVTKLSRMRGAALKLGQMISFQDSKMLPAPIQEVLQRVQDRADYMPPFQRNKVLVSNLGDEWRDLFSSFDERPLAAASIGQVHSAVLKSNGQKVAVKIQYPGVADSIDSDLNNLAILLTASRLLPKGLFLDKTIENARTELAWECDYIREAECGQRFHHFLADEKDVFQVPKLYPEASGAQVLTMEFMEGIGVTRIQSFSQEQRDWIGTQILRLCLREITEFKFMQTDPNWTNFLYNSASNKLELLDFGASRDYPEGFIDKYTHLLAAASKSDRESVQSLSIDLGYLTGQESAAMLDAHIASVLTLAEPFLASGPEVYDFRDQTITERVKALIPVMIRERLAPPPEETYSLHRKLSGAFLLCARLGSRVRCRDLFESSMMKKGIF